jgi:hypothetical protein
MDEQVTQPDDTFDDAYDKARKALLLVGLALNAWLIWDYLKDTPEFQAQRRRFLAWWDRSVMAPHRERLRIRTLERRTVFEAWRIVEEGSPTDG